MSTSNSIENRLQRVEEQLAHEQRQVELLNSVITQLHLDFKQFETSNNKRFERLTEMIESDANGAMPDPNEKPPHY